ncbi:uncharacterized protein A1O9_12715 [Exophiala aquamarina CBS 119918]|uniref:Major facilitator superfamily (MFS) profile domain-containing protein n=1 Tax=Exophiala aquamarina CBS 119918 TaxID=1182545 RepID=A0A072NV08_9EURO|nr:uncharacterized protein A1O9_12715 [Exophiala aquamarina CBS 119918]KEF51212.1 hypothetical protein A1O9_12715 [Exophiala aquamarina CBS 119918]
MYSISVIDRNNLGFAYVAGMQTDLGLQTGDRYTIIVMTFFVTYILCELPSNLILPKAGPANWLSFIGVSFGVVLIGMGFVRQWWALMMCRLLLGALEAGFLPGCTYLITCWYTRFDVGKRLACFWLLQVVCSGLAAIFAYVLSLLGGRHGLNGWSWIFIIEGTITCAVCILGWFILIDFPAKATDFLNAREMKTVVDMINEDRGDAEPDEITGRRLLHHMKDWKIYVWGFSFLSVTVPGYAYNYFLPIILRNGMGYSTTESQLLSAPPYIAAAIMCYVSGWLGDKYHLRGPIVIIHQICTLIGVILTVYGGSNAVRYFGAFLGITALNFCIPGLLTFQANNITSHSKRALVSVTCTVGGALGGIIASVSFKSSETPRYPTGVWVSVAVTLVSIFNIALMNLYFARQNKKVRQGKLQLEGIDGWLYTL